MSGRSGYDSQGYRSSGSATIAVDVFVVGSDSEILTLDIQDFSIADGALGASGTYMDYTFTSIDVY